MTPPAPVARPRRILALVALLIGSGAPAGFAQTAAETPPPGTAIAPRPPRAPAAARSAPTSAPAGCLQCDRLYASDCNFGIWAIEPYLGTSTLVGQTGLADILLDFAITPASRAFGIDASARLHEVDLCTAATTLRGSLGGNGLAGDLASTDLFAQGPPLTRTETSGAYPTTVVGGAVGPLPGEWCNVSSGDLAMDPESGVLYASIVSVILARANVCANCSGDILIRVSPTTGEMLSEVGCLVTTTGQPLNFVYGLAFDSAGQLWGVQGEVGATLLKIDRDTAVATVVPVTGGFNCGFGLASLPCPPGDLGGGRGM